MSKTELNKNQFLGPNGGALEYGKLYLQHKKDPTFIVAVTNYNKKNVNFQPFLVKKEVTGVNSVVTNIIKEAAPVPVQEPVQETVQDLPPGTVIMGDGEDFDFSEDAGVDVTAGLDDLMSITATTEPEAEVVTETATPVDRHAEISTWTEAKVRREIKKISGRKANGNMVFKNLVKKLVELEEAKA